MRTKILTVLVAGLFIATPAFSQSTRLATPSGANAKAPPTKPKAEPKAAAVKTSKETPPASASGKSAGTTSSAADKTVTSAGGAKEPAKVVATPPAATKTVAGNTQGEKVVVAKPATIVRPATVVATAKPAVPGTGQPAVPGTGKPAVPGTGKPAVPGTGKPAVPGTGKPATEVATAKPATLPTETKPDLGKAVEGLASGKLDPKDFTALLAGGAVTPEQLVKFRESGAVPPDTVLKPADVAVAPVTPAVVVPPPPDFSLALKALPAVTETARFKAWTWHAIDQTATDFQVATIWVGVPGGWCESDPARIAQLLNAQPVGQRVLFLWDMTTDLTMNSGDKIGQMTLGGIGTMPSPWMDVGTATVRARMTAFMTAFVNAGGTLDAVLVDNELDLKWGDRYFSPGQFAAIENDPRFPELAAELGFNDLDLIQHLNPQNIRWNEVMGGRFDAALQTAVYDPIRARFPASVVSNYESYAANSNNPTPWIIGTPDLRKSSGFGTHDTHSYYGLISDFLGENRNFGGQAIGRDPFAGFRLQVNRWRSCDLATTRPMQAWIAPANNPAHQYPSNVALTLTNSPYYDEMLLQLGVSGCETFLYWNPCAWGADMNPAEWNTTADQRRLDSSLKELNEVLGQAPGTVVPTRGPAFGDLVVASGRQVGDRMVWRFTFSPSVNAVVVKFTDGSTARVTKEANRPGAWFSYPASLTIVMNSSSSAPDMVIAASP